MALLKPRCAEVAGCFDPAGRNHGLNCSLPVVSTAPPSGMATALSRSPSSGNVHGSMHRSNAVREAAGWVKRARVVVTRPKPTTCHVQTTARSQQTRLHLASGLQKIRDQSNGTYRTHSNACHKPGARRLRRLKATAEGRWSRHPGLTTVA